MAKQAWRIGMNRYRLPGAALRGCVNDVQDSQGVLTQDYGFAAQEITLVTAYAATKQAVQTAIATLRSQARRGDVLFLHYSGHGSNVPDKHGDEADCRDEMLCPTDLAWQDPLLDAWLRQRCDALPAGVNLTVLMAGCQSGTITRRLEPPEAPLLERYLPSPWDLMAVESRRQLRGALRGERAAMRKQANRSQDIVHAQNGPLSYRELHARTRQLVKKGKYAQVPQLEGRNEYFDLPFLAPLE